MDRDLGRLLREIARRTFAPGPRTERERERIASMRHARRVAARNAARSTFRAATQRRSYIG